MSSALPVFLGSTGNFLPPLWRCGGSDAVLSDSLILAKKEDFTITLWIGSKFTSGTLKDKLFICFLFLIPLHVRGQSFLLCSSGTIETEQRKHASPKYCPSLPNRALQSMPGLPVRTSENVLDTSAALCCPVYSIS